MKKFICRTYYLMMKFNTSVNAESETESSVRKTICKINGSEPPNYRITLIVIPFQLLKQLVMDLQRCLQNFLDFAHVGTYLRLPMINSWLYFSNEKKCTDVGMTMLLQDFFANNVLVGK